MVRKIKNKKILKRRYFGELLTEREIRGHALKSQFGAQDIEDIYQKELAGHLVNSFLKWSPKLGIKNEMIERLSIVKGQGDILAQYLPQSQMWQFGTDMGSLPIEIIDYLVLRELCHFHVSSEDEAFHSLISGYMPDYEERAARLKEIRAMGDEWLTEYQ